MDWLKITWKSSRFIHCHHQRNWIESANICSREPAETFTGGEMGKGL